MTSTISRHRKTGPWAVLLFAVLPIWGCKPPASNGAGAGRTEPQKEAQAIEGPYFRFSTAAAVTGGSVEENWCLGRFSEAQVINAEKENPDRRYFYLSPGVTKLAIGPSGMTALFMLRPAANGVVELFNGAHFPECLSMPSNFSPAEPAEVIHYQNHKNLTFSLEAREESGHPLITVELPAGNRYGMDVSRCTNCE